MHSKQALLFFALLTVAAILFNDVILVDASLIGRDVMEERIKPTKEAILKPSRITPTLQPSATTINYRVPSPKPQKQEPKKPYTTLTQQTFACNIIPTTLTSIHSKTRPGILATIATYITETKTPTETKTEHKTCTLDCTTDLTETITTALTTVTEMALGCQNPPVTYTDTLTLFTTEVIPVRNTETVTITLTPEEPVRYTTSTYTVNEVANTVFETQYTECLTPLPCDTVTDTVTIETATITSSLCLDNWSFYKATTTLTEFACFNPFSIYACPQNGVCPLPVTVTEPFPVPAETLTLSQPCVSPPSAPSMLSQCTTVTVMEQCAVLSTELSNGDNDKDKDRNYSEIDVNQVYADIEELLVKLNHDMKVTFPKEKVKVKIHIKLINKMDKLSYQPSLLRSLPRGDLLKFIGQQKGMIESLRRFLKDEVRVHEDQEGFFGQLERLVVFLERQPGGFQEFKRF